MGRDSLIGQVLHDTHRIVRLVGRGGMGTVYEASHVRLKKQRFAVKVLHSTLIDEEKIYARFQREAEIATEIGHPNIVYVLDFYETVDGQPCMVMEYLEGEDLGQRLDREGKIRPGEVQQIIEQVCGALEAVHERGVVHRDLKPANIFLLSSPEGEGGQRVKVLDFGISKIRDSSTQLTGDQAVLGTPHYMSPEQGEGRGRDVDHRTDIFALGTVCYQMLSGQVPFEGPTLPGVIYKICHTEPEPVTAHVPELTGHVNQVLQRAMAKKRGDRYERASDFARELRSALADVKGEAARPMTVIKEDAAEATTRRPLSEGSVSPPRRTAEVDSGTTQLLGVDELLSGAPEERPAGKGPAGRDPVESPPPAEEGPVSTTTTLSDSSGEQPVEGSAPAEPQSRQHLLEIAVLVALVSLGVLAVFFSDQIPDINPGVGPMPMEPGRSAQPRAATTAVPPAPEKAPGGRAGAHREPSTTAASPGPPAALRHPMTGGRITLKLSPASALVLLDGAPRRENPLVLKPSAGVHVLRVEATGYLPIERMVRATGDQTLELTLEKRRTMPPGKMARRKSRRRAPATRNADQRRRATTRRQPAREMPFAGGLEDEGRRKAPAPAKDRPRKATPFSGEL